MAVVNIPYCQEGALQIINGKAKLISDIYCDGLGNCIGHCPQGAIKIIEREAEIFDPIATKKHIAELKQKYNQQQYPIDNNQHSNSCACPGAIARDLTAEKNGINTYGQLRHWPIQLKLVAYNSPF